MLPRGHRSRSRSVAAITAANSPRASLACAALISCSCARVSHGDIARCGALCARSAVAAGSSVRTANAGAGVTTAELVVADCRCATRGRGASVTGRVVGGVREARPASAAITHDAARTPSQNLGPRFSSACVGGGAFAPVDGSAGLAFEPASGGCDRAGTAASTAFSTAALMLAASLPEGRADRAARKSDRQELGAFRSSLHRVGSSWSLTAHLRACGSVAPVARGLCARTAAASTRFVAEFPGLQRSLST